MKKEIVIIIALLSFLVCCEPDDENQRRNFILAGERSEGMTYKDFDPDIIVSTSPQLIDTSIEVDLNNDGKLDFTVSSFYGAYNYYGDLIVKYDSANIIEISSYYDKNGWTYSPSVSYYDGYLNKLVFNDTIRQSKFWTHNSWSAFGLRFSKDWLNNDNYIGIRFIEKKDTLYGWVNVILKSQFELEIKDCAYQVK